MKKISMLLFVVLCASVVAGCAINRTFTQGKDFDATKREQIVKGQSTQADVLKIYGEPANKGIDDKYNEFWVYVYAESQNSFNMWTNSSNGNEHVKKLMIVFDHNKNNVVENFVFSDSTNPTKFK